MIQGVEEERDLGDVERRKVGVEQPTRDLEEGGLPAEKGREEDGCIVPFDDGVEGDGFGGLVEEGEGREEAKGSATTTIPCSLRGDERDSQSKNPRRR